MADTLVLYDATLDVPLAAGFLGWGTVIRRSSAERTFRVANTSLIYTAETVTIAVADTGAAADPSQAATHLLSLDGRSFTAGLDLGDLPPGTASSPITLRRVTPSTADTGAWTFEVVAAAAAFTAGSPLPAEQTVL